MNVAFTGGVTLGLAEQRGVIFLGRKSHYVQTINHKDIDFLNALRCAGLCTKEQATKFISANRLKNFVLDKTIEKCTYISDTGHRQEIYRISEQGQKWIAKNIDTLADRCYYRSTGVEHDLKLMDKVLPQEEERRKALKDKLNKWVSSFAPQGSNRREVLKKYYHMLKGDREVNWN